MFLSHYSSIEILIGIFMQWRNRILIPHPKIRSIWLIPLKIGSTYKIFHTLINILNKLLKLRCKVTILMLYIGYPIIMYIFIFFFWIFPINNITNFPFNLTWLDKILIFNRIGKTIRCNWYRNWIELFC